MLASSYGPTAKPTKIIFRSLAAFVYKTLDQRDKSLK